MPQRPPKPPFYWGKPACQRPITPEVVFPRLEARIQKTDDDAYWLQIWLWKGPGDGGGGEREQVFNGKRAGSYEDMRQAVYGHGYALEAAVGPDDITVDDS